MAFFFLIFQCFNNAGLSLFYRKAAIIGFIAAQCNGKHNKETVDEEDYSGLNEEVKNAEEPKEAISVIKKYEELLKRENRKNH